eukprot:gene10225-11927_t
MSLLQATISSICGVNSTGAAFAAGATQYGERAPSPAGARRVAGPSRDRGGTEEGPRRDRGGTEEGPSREQGISKSLTK